MEETRLRLVTLGRLELVGAGPAGDALNKRPRKLAVLAMLALAGRPVARDVLVEMFWGSQPEARARHSLSDALSHLRRALGAEAIVARPSDVALDRAAGALEIDAEAFARAVQAGEWARALALHGGEFLAGVTVEDSHSFDEWCAREAARLRALFVQACQGAYDGHVARAEWHDAERVAARWVAGAPDSARGARALARAQSTIAESARPTPPPEGPLAVERAALAVRWRRARDTGRRQLVVMRGSPSRAAGLVGELVARARADGAMVVTARAREEQRETDGALLRELLAGIVDAPGLAAAHPAHLGALAHLSPVLAARFRVATDPPTPAQLAAALRAVLEGVAYETPVLLRLEALEAGDEPSRRAIEDALAPPLPASLLAVCVSGGEEALAGLVERARRESPEDVETLATASRSAALAAAVAAADAEAAGPARGRRRWSVPIVLVSMLLLALAVTVAAARWLVAGGGTPVVAVGFVREELGRDTAALSHALPELFATSLARVPGLRVLSRARMYEVLAAQGMAGAAGDSARALVTAARAAGATVVVEGELRRVREAYRLDMRELDVASGAVRHAVTLTGDDAYSLVDRATAELARAHGLTAPFEPLRDVTSASLGARRLYDDGLRAFYRGDPATARALFLAALREDSTFAMAAHYLARTADSYPERDAAITRALRLAARATERERLLIRALWLPTRDYRAAFADAESLVARYPDEIEGPLLLGQARRNLGDFAEAMRLFRRVAAADSAGLAGVASSCPGCEALGELRVTAVLADSFDVAERALRQLVDTRRWSPHLAWEVGLVVAQRGGIDTAEAMLRGIERRVSGQDMRYNRALLDIRAGRLARAEATLRTIVRERPVGSRGNELESLALVHRLQGRYAEAIRDGEAYVQDVAMTLAPRDTVPWFAPLPLAIAELQGGDPRAAATHFERIARGPFAPPAHVASIARQRAWFLTHAATAYARAGDTARLGALADSIRRIGALSGYARDQRLHRYVRALLELARRDTAAALASLEAARYSAVETYLAIPLARAQLARGRAADAAYTAAAALRGPLDSQNQYESRTELHEVLGDALLARGDRAGAARAYRLVAQGWAAADAPWAARGARARARADSLAGPVLARAGR